MAKLDGKLIAESELPLDLQELLAAMSPEAGADEESWREAIARYLSGSDDWREALALLDGGFTCGVGGSDAGKEQ